MINIGGLVFMAAGLLFFGIGLWFFYGDITATGWDEENGLVSHSSVRQVYDSEGDVMYKADIRYSYEYEGESFNGYCCGYSTSDQWGMEKLSRECSEGSVIRVYVNPEEPYQSRIVKEVNPYNLLNMAFMGIGGLFATIGAGITFNLIRGQTS